MSLRAMGRAVVLVFGLVCAVCISGHHATVSYGQVPIGERSDQSFKAWQLRNRNTNLKLERARTGQLQEAIQKLDTLSKRSARASQDELVRIQAGYLAARGTLIGSTLNNALEGKSDLSSAIQDAGEDAGKRIVETLAKTLTRSGASGVAQGLGRRVPAATAAVAALDVTAKIVDLRQQMEYVAQLEETRVSYERGRLDASMMAAEKRRELAAVQENIRALEGMSEGAAGGQGISPKGVKIYFDDRILARVLGRFGDPATDESFERLRKAVYGASDEKELDSVYRSLANDEKARFIRETKKTVTVRNVALVSLNAVARAAGGTPNKEVRELGGLSRVYGFVLVPESRDVVLVGEVEPGVPPLGVDNLITALKTVWKDGVVPTVSLDVDPNSPFAPQQVRVSGIPKNSRFSLIMLDADYLAKRLVAGDPTLSPKIPGLRSHADVLRDTPHLEVPGGSRFWLTPEQPDEGEIQISSEEDVVLFETAVRVLTEEMQWVGRIHTGTGRIDPAMEIVVESLTKRYGELERRWPVFRQLHGLFDLVMLSKILYQLDVDVPALAVLAALPHTPHSVPNSYPAVVSEEEIRGHIFIAAGGVVANNYVGDRHHLHYDAETMAQLRKKGAILSRSGRIAAQAKGITLTLVVPSGRQRHFAEGMKTLANGQYSKAEAWFTRVINEDPYFGEAYAQRSLAQYNLGKLREALSDFDRSIELLPGDKMLQAMRYALLIEMGREPSQIRMDAGTKQELANLMLHQAEFEFENGDGSASLRSLNLALTFNSKDTDALTFRALVRLGGGDAEGTLEDAGLAIQLEPDSARAYTIRGMAGLALGSKDEDFYEDAFEDFTKAIELEPEVPDWWFNRANVHHHWGNRRERDLDRSAGHQAAIQRYTKLITDQPDNAVLYLGRGQKKMEAKQLKSAIEDFTVAIQKDSSMALAYVERAGVLHSLQRYQDALADAAKAIQVDSKFARGYATRGAALLKLGRNDEALRDCNAAIQIDPNHGHAYLIRGLIRQATGDRISAIRDWREAQRVDPAQTEWYQQLIDMAQEHLQGKEVQAHDEEKP